MAKENYIFKYYQKIKDGSIVVGEYIELLYAKIIKMLEDKELVYDAKKANAAVEWIGKHSFHTEGDLAPGALKLELWQKALIACMFGLVDDNGKRHFREVLLIVARKNGKSLFASAIARYIWLVDGGYGAKVYNIAPKLDQADIIYNNIWIMTTLDPEWQKQREQLEADKRAKVRSDDPMLARHRMTDLFVPGTNGTVKKIAFSAKKSDGFNPSICICDEVASWEGDKGLKQYEVMKSGMGARSEPLLLSCSTAGYINDSIYDELVTRATRFLKGDSKETRLLPFLYVIDDLSKWNDINELQKSNPNLGVSVTVDYLLEEIAIAEGSLSKKAEFLTKYCNIKQNSSQAWLDYQDVDKASGEALRFEDFQNTYAVVGIDLSQTTDLTAACCVIERDEHFYIFSKFFLPAEKIEEATARDGLPYRQYIQRGLLQASGDNFVDYNDVLNWCIDLVKKYKIYPLVVGYDRYSANYLVTDLEKNHFKCDDVFQGNQLYPIIKNFEGLLKDGRIHIGDNDLLKVHMLNAALKMDNELNRGKLVKIRPEDHIDGIAAVIDAFTVRDKWWRDYGQRLKNETKKK